MFYDKLLRDYGINPIQKEHATYSPFLMKRGGYSLKPVKDSLMLSPLAMKTGGIVNAELYKDVRNIGFGNKTYLPTI